MSSRKVYKFFSLSFSQKCMFFEALFWLVLAKLLIVLVPFRKIAPYLGVLNGDVRSRLSSAETKKSEAVKLAILMTSGNVGWKSVCLDQAMAASVMLKRRKVPHQLCMGVKKDEQKAAIEAHAWIMCGDKILIGGQRSRLFAVTALFARNF